MTGVTRAQFFTNSAKGGVALVAGGSVLAVATAPAVAQAQGDVQIAKLAATAEQVAIAFYEQMLDNNLAKEGAIDRNYLTEARKNEQTHLDTLKQVLGDQAPQGVSPTFPEGTFSDLRSAAKTGQALEEAFIGTYLGAISNLESTELQAAAAQIAANESQHLSVFTDFLNEEPISLEALPQTVTADEARQALSPFLGG